jgi:hypothetical protein
MARGRKSAVSLSVVPTSLPGERPPPPAELDEIEARLWRTIVDALPPTWLDAAAQTILVRAVAQAAICEDLECQLRKFRAARLDDDEVAVLAAHRASAAKAHAHLLGVLRATPRARMVPKSASRQMVQVPRVRPWEADDG